MKKRKEGRKEGSGKRKEARKDGWDRRTAELKNERENGRKGERKKKEVKNGRK